MCYYYTRALAIREAVLGSRHPSTATSLSNLATLHQDMGAPTVMQLCSNMSLIIMIIMNLSCYDSFMKVMSKLYYLTGQ